MAVINDCSPPNALALYNQRALDDLLRRFHEQFMAIQPVAEQTNAAINDLRTELDSILTATGLDADALSTKSCTLPKSPTTDDIEAMASSPDLTLINGGVILPGSLSLTALQRLYSIFKSVNAVYNLIPEMFLVSQDSEFGSITITPRLLVVSLKRVRKEIPRSECSVGEPEYTETEQLVSVNRRVPRDDDDRIVVCVWVGAADFNDILRARLVDLGFTDDEIVNIALQKTTESLELYQIKDPVRLGRYLMQFGEADETFITTLLTRGPSSINDKPVAADIVNAIRNALTNPVQQGCGIPSSIALLASLDVNRLFHREDCDSHNIFQPVNEIFGAMGTIQTAIKKVMAEAQSYTAITCAMLADITSYAEMNLLGVGVSGMNDSVSAAVTTPGSGIGVESAGNFTQANGLVNSGQGAVATPGNDRLHVPGIPQINDAANVTSTFVSTWVHKLNETLELVQDFVNAFSQIVVGMSLLVCTYSQFGDTVATQPLNVPGIPKVKRKFPKCQQNKLEANLDISGIMFDALNQAVHDLLDILARLRSLALQIETNREGPAAMFQLKCSITETVQLALDISKRIAAGNFGGFSIEKSS